MLELRARWGLLMFKPGEEVGQGSVGSQKDEAYCDTEFYD